MDVNETPMMKQFRDIKAQYPDAILLFRCGDFYETYAEDAVRASKLLGITLTHRSNGTKTAVPIDMAGFPFHALDTYLPKLVRAGMRVAICDQLEDPKTTKKLVKRGITELVTPGVSYSDTTLPLKENNWVAGLCLPRKENETVIGISFLDISTGEFMASQGQADYIDKLLVNFAPKEVLILRGMKDSFEHQFGRKYYTYELEDWMFTPQSAQDRLLKQYAVTTLKGFGFEIMPLALIAAGAILHYLDLTQHLETGHLQHLSRIEEDGFVWMDRFTLRNLELVDGQRDESKTLCDVLDHTRTPMGGRLLRRWICFPLKQVSAIQERQQTVEYLLRHPDERQQIIQCLNCMQDMERTVSKIATARISPREIKQLGIALRAMEPIRAIALSSDPDSAMYRLGGMLDTCSTLAERIEHDIAPNPPAMAGRPDIFARGVDAKLDELRDIQTNGKDFLNQLQQREVQKTGISSLKIGYNNVFGYYLEVRNTYRDMVPQEWIRKQTLVSAERYITEELKQYEDEILNAESRIAEIEAQLYAELLLAMSDYLPPLQRDAMCIAQLDCLMSFADVATAYHYVCPAINDSLSIKIRRGRHPVIECQLPLDEEYVPNDVELNNDGQQIIILTGPNMAGKSALLRQTALIVLMAQMGCYVPADSAEIGVVDKIFTRVGASDNISMGESTFMVEMTEAAGILNNLSERSLVLFDELGRGTSTYDGISIAWAIVEYLHECRFHPKTLFATHYHELNEMEKTFDRIRNWNVAVKESDGKIIFLRQMRRGGSEHSFGIHVAKLAGMPKRIVDRANAILTQLEGISGSKNDAALNAKPTLQIGQTREGMQLSFFQLDDPVLEQIRDELEHLDVNQLTPLEALNKLNDIQSLVGGKK